MYVVATGFRQFEFQCGEVDRHKDKGFLQEVIEDEEVVVDLGKEVG